MALTTDELKLIISAQTTGMKQGVAEAKNEITDLNKQAKASNAVFSSAGKSIAGMVAKVAGAAAIFTGLKKSMTLAIDEVENWNLFAVSLGRSAEATAKWATVVEDKLGVSAAWIRQYTGVMTNMVSSMGLNEAQSTALGKSVALLSQDFASFYNQSPEQMFEKISSAMAGMPRPLQDLGIMVRQAEVELYALNHGLIKQGEEMNSATRAAATFGAILGQTKNAQGDLARTLNTPANQLRALGTNFTNLGIAIGNMFIPLAQAVLPVLNGIVIAATSAFQALAGLFGIKIEKDSLDDVAGGFDGVGDAASGAGTAAKKLQKQLAGFDEMTVLKDMESGSGGAGSGGAGGGYLGEIDLSYLDAMNKLMDGIDNKAKEIADSIGKYFNNLWDFKKIGKSFDKLWGDIKKGGKDVFKVIADVWKSYLEPIVGWAGNSLLPAFLNALGGAVQFVGAVISQAWSVLKPFIDVFVVPIAQFAGSILVGVLNGIGEALRWIAGNQAAVTIITDLTLAFVALRVATEAWSLIQAGATAAFSFFSAAASGAASGLGTLAFQVGSSTGSFGLMASGVSTAGMATTTFSGMLSSLGASFMAVAPPVALVAAGIAEFTLIAETAKLRSMEAAFAENNRMTIAKMSEKTQKDLNIALEFTNRVLDELNGKVAKAEEVELRYLQASDLAKTLRETYTKAQKSGTYSTEELRQMELKAIIAERESADSKAALDAAQNDVTDGRHQYGEEQLYNIGLEEKVKLLEDLKAGRYREIAFSLDNLRKSTQYYADENGKMIKASTEDVKAMADNVARELGKVDGTWRSMYDTATRTGASYRDAWNTIDSIARSAGKNMQSGITQGITDNQWRVNGAAKDSATGAMNAFNSALKIKSPSRVMMQSGMWFTEGIAEGIEGHAGAVKSAVEDVAGVATGAFAPGDYQIAGVDFGVGSPNLDSISSSIDIDAEKTPVHVVVKVGEDTLVDKIVDAINEASMMRNSTVIAV